MIAELGITPRAYCVLFHALERERTQIELAAISDLDKTTMVVTIDDSSRRVWRNADRRAQTAGPGSSR